MNSRLANDKTLEELEEERMARFINTPANERQAVTFKKPTVTPVAEPVKASPRKWEPKASPPAANISRVQNTPPSPKPAAQPAPSPRAQPQSQGCLLSGTMDLSTRVQHLNSLLEQMAIDEDEYAARAEPLQVAQSIIQACTSGDFASLQRLLQENPRMNVDLIVQNEATPFSVAIAALISGKGRSNILEVLIQHGAQVNRRKAGVSPLLSICTRATFPDAVNCVRVLLEHGADAKATTVVSGKGEPRSCISLAVECNASPEIIRLLLQHGAGANDLLAPHGPLLMASIIEEQFDIAFVLLEFGADPNCRQIASGACCLALAVNNKHVQLCEALIQNGADRDLPAIRDQKTTVRQLVAQLAQRDQVGYQRIERLF